MLSKPYYRFFERLAFSLLFIASIRRVFLPGSLFLDPNTFEKVAIEVVLWILVVVIFLSLIKKKEKNPDFFLLWKLNWPVLIFISLAALSLLWSVNFPVTLYKVFVLIASTIAAAYIGVSLDVGGFLNKLAWFCAIVAGMSFYLAIALPDVGIHQGHPYYGAWRGIFWTRGRLGAFMAFANLVFLFQVASSIRKVRLLVPKSVFYLLTLALVFLTRSATSIILVASLHFSFLVAALWMNFRDRLRKPHYITFGILALFLMIAALTNLEFLFGLLGRETNLTGRAPMWEYLLREVFIQKPILGYGFATIWDHNNFRIFMQDVVGWLYPVLIADNGFLDILLNLGIVGAASFLVVFVLTFVRAFRFAFSRDDILNFFPLLLMVYALVVNISLSHFFELEFFVWILAASALFITTPGYSK